MADYKELISGTFSNLMGKVKDSGVVDVYAQGTNRAKAYGQIAKLTLAVNRDHEELSRVYTEIGRLYYEQAKDAPEGYFAPLFEQARKLAAGIQDKQAQIQSMKDSVSVESESSLDGDISAFDDIVSAAERDATATPEE
ncbi:MAG: hypothetical protein IJV41_09865 [Oscillospiraceae bacterium]|nr:hypothetical protein [Oscillospiraceae bacterium]